MAGLQETARVEKRAADRGRERAMLRRESMLAGVR